MDSVCLYSILYMKLAYPYIENPLVQIDVETLKRFTWSTILGATTNTRHGQHQTVTPRRRYDNNNNIDTVLPEKYPSGSYTSSSTQKIH